jgi:hypothetical protein
MRRQNGAHPVSRATVWEMQGTPHETREDPRGPPDPDQAPFGEEPHVDPGSTSTSEPHPSEDPEAKDRWEGPKRDRLDD